MSIPPGASEAPTSTRLDIRRLPWTSQLAADYAYDFGKLRPFFAGDVRSGDDWRRVITRVQAQPRDRAALVAMLRRQQVGRGAHAAAGDAAALLGDERAVVVATGQQAGLFGGPLYTLLKALSALSLADSIQRTHGIPAVAVFWVDAEDHDWTEVNACPVLDADERLTTIALADEPPPSGCPVARVRLGPSVDLALQALETALPATEFTAGVLEDLRRAYRPGVGMADAFARWLEGVLGPRGLVVFDSSDVSAKLFATSVFAQELARPGDTSRMVSETGRALESLGYHAQVVPQADAPALFHCSQVRVAVRRADGAALAVGDDVRPVSSWVDAARQQPESFSPNVLLRPVVQDSIFPTVAYVAGPSELAYFAELRQVYDAFGVPMPLVYPRASATLVDSNVARFLGRGDVSFATLRAQDEAALNALLAAALPASLDEATSAASQAIDTHMLRLAAEAAAIDATLEGAARSALGRMQDDLRKLQGKILQAAKRKDDTVRRQFKHAQAWAFPGGAPQERALATVACFNRFGPGLVDRLAETIDLQPGLHALVTP